MPPPLPQKTLEILLAIESLVKAGILNLLELSCLANMVIWCTESVKLQLQVTW